MNVKTISPHNGDLAPSDEETIEALQLLLDHGEELVSGTFVPDCFGGGSYKFLYQQNQCFLDLFTITINHSSAIRSLRVGISSVDSAVGNLPPADNKLAETVQALLEDDNTLIAITFVPNCTTGGSYKIFYQFRNAQQMQESSIAQLRHQFQPERALVLSGSEW